MNKIKIEKEKTKDLVVKTLKGGGLVITPTETCYGVMCDARNPSAVVKLLTYKKRPEGRSIPVAVSNELMANRIVELNPQAKKLIHTFLPGPVTVICNSLGEVDERLEAENGTLGLRMPSFHRLIEIIEQFNNPVALSSAGLNSDKIPYSISDIDEKKLNSVDLVVDAGDLPRNPLTTVIDTTKEELVVYRKGRIDPTKSQTISSNSSESVDQSIKIAEDFTKTILQKNSPVVVLLNGELGAGKTHFVKGIAKTLGITQTIKSPTYNYFDEYTFNNSKLFHLDAWRITSKEDLDALRIHEWLKPGNVIVVEWPSVALNFDETVFDMGEVYWIEITINGEEKRGIKIYKV